jgi:signal transduction histidine kinase
VDDSNVVLTPPPLTRWQWTWRYAVAVLVSALTWGDVAKAEWQHARWLFWTDLALGLASYVIYAYHRRAQVGVAIVTTLLGTLSAVAAGPGVLAFISMATRRRWREIVGVSVLNLACGAGFEAMSPDNGDAWVADLVLIIFVTGIAAAGGLYIGARRELLLTLRDRADRAEREQSMRVAQARTNERARIAREMHDVLAHRISLVAMHAGALSYRGDLTPEESRVTAEIIQQNAHHALLDLREILGVLRDSPTPDLVERPQPTLRDLAELIEDEQRAGAHIRVVSSVEYDAVPASIGRNAYRMVQESLTNARKHAPDTTVQLKLEGGPGAGLRIEVRNPARVGMATGVPGAGLGLIGLAERAELSGGHLEHFTDVQGDFVVDAWLPWPS